MTFALGFMAGWFVMTPPTIWAFCWVVQKLALHVAPGSHHFGNAP